MEYMSLDDVLSMMKSAIDVYDWNQKRRIVMYNVDPKLQHKVLVVIDAYGLGARVAKSNHWPARQ